MLLGVFYENCRRPHIEVDMSGRESRFTWTWGAVDALNIASKLTTSNHPTTVKHKTVGGCPCSRPGILWASNPIFVECEGGSEPKQM